jgi:hypothetical protein
MFLIQAVLASTYSDTALKPHLIGTTEQRNNELRTTVL